MVMNSFCYEGVLFDFGRGEEAFAGTTRLFSFGGGVPRPELEPPLVAGRVTVSIAEFAELCRSIEAVEGRSPMILNVRLGVL